MRGLTAAAGQGPLCLHQGRRGEPAGVGEADPGDRGADRLRRGPQRLVQVRPVRAARPPDQPADAGPSHRRRPPCTHTAARGRLMRCAAADADRDPLPEERELGGGAERGHAAEADRGGPRAAPARRRCRLSDVALTHARTHAPRRQNRKREAGYLKRQIELVRGPPPRR